MLKIRKGAKIIAVALTFGVVASMAFQGTNYLFNQFDSGTEESQTAELNVAQTSASSSDTAESSSSGSTSDVSAIAEAAMPSLVAITNQSVQEMQNWFGQSQVYESESSGSGIIVGQTDTELLIVTNNHVVDGAQTISVGFVDETVAEAQLKGADSDHDIAVVSVNLSDLSSDTLSSIKQIEIGSSSELKVGEQVIAIGNALGYGQSVTTGIVSALNRPVTIDGVTNELIQTDAAINPGNSGGALLNMKGEVIGINAAKYSSTNVEGMGYAIPISFAQDIIEDLMNRSTKLEVAEDDQGYLGIQLQNIDQRMSEAYGMPQGVYVYKIVSGGAADKSDLRERDIITKFDGETVRTGDDLQQLLTYYKGGTTVTLTVQSLEDGAYVERQVDVTLDYKKDHVNAPQDTGQAGE